MLLAFFGNIRTRWTSLLLCIVEYFSRARWIVSGISKSYKVAPIEILESRDKQRAEFIEMVKKMDITKLASYHNHGKLCEQFREPESGSFNVCFFVQYIPDGEKRVLRFPLVPVLHNPYDNLLSELATME